MKNPKQDRIENCSMLNCDRFWCFALANYIPYTSKNELRNWQSGNDRQVPGPGLDAGVKAEKDVLDVHCYDVLTLQI